MVIKLDQQLAPHAGDAEEAESLRQAYEAFGMGDSYSDMVNTMNYMAYVKSQLDAQNRSYLISSGQLSVYRVATTGIEYNGKYKEWYSLVEVETRQETQGRGPESEFNISFTFGPQAGFELGELLSLDLKLWSFGAISTKDDLGDDDFHDGKITSEHSFSLNLFGLSFGKGLEHKLAYDSGSDEPFTQSDVRWIDTSIGHTTKTDELGRVIDEEHHNTIFSISPIFFSVEITKDPRK